MKAMILQQLASLQDNSRPLSLAELPQPIPRPGEILLQVSVCGVCHTELDEIEGRTPPSKLPAILGHQVVGLVRQTGPGAARFKGGERIGVAWIYAACGTCIWCRSGRENLCPNFQATGRDAPGGYAEYMTISEDFAYPLPAGLSDVQAAPLLCAGAIGYRALRLTGLQDGQPLGLTGFGASAHLVLQLTRHLFPRSRVLVFARSEEERAFALKLGAAWAGDTWEKSPVLLQAIIDTTPAWGPVAAALLFLQAGGRLVINAIRKEENDKSVLQQLDYARMLWMEKEVKSVANITRQDVTEFLSLAARIPLRPQVQLYSLAEANQALSDLKQGHIRGAKVLVVAG